MKLTIKAELELPLSSEDEANNGSTTGLRFLDLRSSSSSTVYARISLSDCF